MLFIGIALMMRVPAAHAQQQNAAGKKVYDKWCSGCHGDTGAGDGVASKVMFFTALIGSYLILRFAHPEAWKPPGVVLNIPVTAVNTFLLICSSVTMVKAFAAAQDGFLNHMKWWLLATAIIGASFVGVQIYEYTHLIEKGFVPSEGIYGSTFYTMTGFHGFHVTVGVICMQNLGRLPYTSMKDRTSFG